MEHPRPPACLPPMTPKTQRLWFTLCAVACISAATLLTLQALEQDIVFFYAPSDLQTKAPAEDTLVRVGGLVKEGSVRYDTGQRVMFTVTDGAHDLTIHATEALPALFREGQGVVAEGYLTHGVLKATRILAKHDETYMPPEVAAALKKSGHWKAPAP